LVLAATPGLSIEMSQTNQSQQGAAAAESRPRKDLELFWRIIAGLMLVIIAWIVWVLYQITPRSVVTPLVYESQIKRIGAQQSEAGVATAPVQPASANSAAQDGAGALPVPAPEAVAAALRMDQAQAALRAGAHESSADVQAADLESRIEPVQGRRLKLSTEITTPLDEKKAIPKQPQARSDGAPPPPAATDQAGKIRP
jgi:hypothetical protein